MTDQTTEPAQTPAAAGEPWPDWLADLTPAERPAVIAQAVAALYQREQPAYEGPRCTVAQATALLTRLLSEAADFPVIRASQAQLAAARAALCRLALDDPLSAVEDEGATLGWDANRRLRAELTARLEHADGALETIARLTSSPATPGIPASEDADPEDPGYGAALGCLARRNVRDQHSADTTGVLMCSLDLSHEPAAHWDASEEMWWLEGEDPCKPPAMVREVLEFAAEDAKRRLDDARTYLRSPECDALPDDQRAHLLAIVSAGNGSA